MDILYVVIKKCTLFFLGLFIGISTTFATQLETKGLLVYHESMSQYIEVIPYNRNLIKNLFDGEILTVAGTKWPYKLDGVIEDVPYPLAIQRGTPITEELTKAMKEKLANLQIQLPKYRGLFQSAYTSWDIAEKKVINDARLAEQERIRLANVAKEKRQKEIKERENAERERAEREKAEQEKAEQEKAALAKAESEMNEQINARITAEAKKETANNAAQREGGPSSPTKDTPANLNSASQAE